MSKSPGLGALLGLNIASLDAARRRKRYLALLASLEVEIEVRIP